MNIFTIAVNSPAECENVIEKLELGGFSGYVSRDTNAIHVEPDLKHMGWHSDDLYSVLEFIADKQKEGTVISFITSKQFLENPSLIPGLKTAKEMTVAEISEALGYDVKVVKD